MLICSGEHLLISRLDNHKEFSAYTPDQSTIDNWVFILLDLFLKHYLNFNSMYFLLNPKVVLDYLFWFQGSFLLGVS